MIFFKTVLLWLVLGGGVGLRAADAPPADPFAPLAFLEGSWSATAKGQNGVATSGSYTFRLELDNHILARHSSHDTSAKTSVNFDYKHGDLLYVYQEMPGQPLKAIYFDNEGHVLHYDVTTPAPTSVVFLSEAPPGAPHFRLMYERKGNEMSGKFQIMPPGAKDWMSYLEWDGRKM